MGQIDNIFKSKFFNFINQLSSKHDFHALELNGYNNLTLHSDWLNTIFKINLTVCLATKINDITWLLDQEQNRFYIFYVNLMKCQDICCISLKDISHFKLNFIANIKGTMFLYFNCDLKNPNLDICINNRFIIHSNAKAGLEAYQNHYVSDTKSLFDTKTILHDKSTFYCLNQAHIISNLENTSAYQNQFNVILSGNAKIFTQPFLNIDSFKVACKHSSAITSFKKDNLFYGAIRGFNLDNCNKFLAQSLFKQDLCVMGQKFIDNIFK